MENVHKWFPMVNKDTRAAFREFDIDIDRWILENIVSKFQFDDSFNFGLYVIEYIVHETKIHTGRNLNKMYDDYLKDIGIDWNILH